jgi:photoactive yellow protein
MTDERLPVPASGPLPSADPGAEVDRLFGPEGVRTVFEPLYDCAGPLTVVGREALMRGPRGLPFEGPMLAFALAKSMAVLEALDLRCFETALATAPADGLLFVNLHPSTLTAVPAERILCPLRACGRDPGSVVVEVIEHEAGGEAPLVAAVARLKREGLRVAVDDFGEGAANLRRVLQLKPDFVKVDRWFVQGAEDDPARRAVLRAMAGFGAETGVRVIAEGLDNGRQLRAVRECGVLLVQGHGMEALASGREPAARPAPAPAPDLLLRRIDAFDERRLDELPWGVIQLSHEGVVLQYNRYEEGLAGRRAAEVIGRNFFTEVAPCTDVQEFAGRFREGVAAGALHATFDFVMAFQPPRRVTVTLYLSAATGTIWVFVRG